MTVLAGDRGDLDGYDVGHFWSQSGVAVLMRRDGEPCDNRPGSRWFSLATREIEADPLGRSGVAALLSAIVRRGDAITGVAPRSGAYARHGSDAGV